ncbi:hypothetical protein KBY91_29855 [Streptomyces sp. RK23]|uniref:hypothetical protein n=1 Tax=Streptomyces TaxID=1883 RepID=UPI0011477472|nr:MULTISPECIES: hypothetical protein [unclassified Streptomyces]MBQ0967666.1 hypothetical protein [Streptomyces sp. RK74B]MBQ1007620.1 hypothetical protein [Streptomyces sp. RK23]MZE43013.1 hypothetical protein [Streptomyces sp. SID5477]
MLISARICAAVAAALVVGAGFAVPSAMGQVLFSAAALAIAAVAILPEKHLTRKLSDGMWRGPTAERTRTAILASFSLLLVIMAVVQAGASNDLLALAAAGAGFAGFSILLLTAHERRNTR